MQFNQKSIAKLMRDEGYEVHTPINGEPDLVNDEVVLVGTPITINVPNEWSPCGNYALVSWDHFNIDGKFTEHDVYDKKQLLAVVKEYVRRSNPGGRS